ncbi:hypothetical protein DB30_05069 [Enhygromyxa salina]|uniref:Uncharacterized protein n=1 Tax=Enhygromyxa salina TaxID=215803 RepID=A0A0C2D2L8_9BACT|nr:hypothetical protein DB30_05069 [Enhygromyxa salina]
MEPDDCFERCMTLLPKLHEENQCGSRELNYLWCVGALTCEGYAAFTEANSELSGSDCAAPCVAEIRAPCSTEAPFDPDEPLPTCP